MSMSKQSDSQTEKAFILHSPYKPAGDQGKVIEAISNSLEGGKKEQTILGVTGSGKTFMMASIIEKLQKPTIVFAHNKTLAAQLAEEFRRFFPNNAVHYFVSYYDYYQPESYLPTSDTYIEKQTEINQEIERLRNAAVQALLTRKDVLIVASVSAIYGLGNPEDFEELSMKLQSGQSYNMQKLARRLADMQFSRNQIDYRQGSFRIKGEFLEVVPASEEVGYRFSFWGDRLEEIISFNLLTGQKVEKIDSYTIFPASPYVKTDIKITNAIPAIEAEMVDRIAQFENDNRFLEAQRIKERVSNDLEMLKSVGFVSGIENYALHFDNRLQESPPKTLLDFFPDDSICFIDESHITLPQIGAMYYGDRSRKESLVRYGFRLPSAFSNRPLQIHEFFGRIDRKVYVSATPGNFELGFGKIPDKNNAKLSKKYREKLGSDKTVKRDVIVSEAVIRPTGLLDPEIVIKPVENQVDDVMEQVRLRIEKNQRVLITTLTKKFAEELDLYFKQLNIKSAYIHSDVDTLERLDILSDLRRGKYDVLIGINLLREGLDLPEVSLIAIFDADKEGFLRSETSLIQIVGRASRHVDGKVIMYANTITKSMRNAIDETDRRRKLQTAFNKKHGIVPESTKRDLETIADDVRRDMDELGQEEFRKIGDIEDDQIEDANSRNGRYVDATGKKIKERVGRGRQIFSDFERERNRQLSLLEMENYSKTDLEEIMNDAIKDTNFERADAAKRLIDSL